MGYVPECFIFLLSALKNTFVRFDCIQLLSIVNDSDKAMVTWNCLSVECGMCNRVFPSCTSADDGSNKAFAERCMERIWNELKDLILYRICWNFTAGHNDLFPPWICHYFKFGLEESQYRWISNRSWDFFILKLKGLLSLFSCLDKPG